MSKSNNANDSRQLKAEEKKNRTAKVAVVLAERLKVLRGKRTISKVAEEIGITRQTLGEYEEGTKTVIDFDILHQIARFYNVSMDYLCGDDDGTQHNINDFMKVSGLSEAAVNYLAECSDDDKKTISLLLESLNKEKIVEYDPDGVPISYPFGNEFLYQLLVYCNLRKQEQVYENALAMVLRDRKKSKSLNVKIAKDGKEVTPEIFCWDFQTEASRLEDLIDSKVYRMSISFTELVKNMSAIYLQNSDLSSTKYAFTTDDGSIYTISIESDSPKK